MLGCEPASPAVPWCGRRAGPCRRCRSGSASCGRQELEQVFQGGAVVGHVHRHAQDAAVGAQLFVGADAVGVQGDEAQRSGRRGLAAKVAASLAVEVVLPTPVEPIRAKMPPWVSSIGALGIGGVEVALQHLAWPIPAHLVAGTLLTSAGMPVERACGSAPCEKPPSSRLLGQACMHWAGVRPSLSRKAMRLEALGRSWRFMARNSPQQRGVGFLGGAQGCQGGGIGLGRHGDSLGGGLGLG